MSQTPLASPLVKFCLVGILSTAVLYAWEQVGNLSAHLAEIPVLGQVAVVDGATARPKVHNAEFMRTLAPLLIESTQKAHALQAAVAASAAPRDDAGATLDQLFGRRAVADKAAPAAAGALGGQPVSLPAPVVVAVDYFGMLGQHLELDAISLDGAVLNGRFYSTGARIDEFAYPNAKGTALVSAKLRSVNVQTKTVTVSAAQGPRAFSLRLK